MKKQNAMNNKGFSLMELVIVVAIMAILIGVMSPQLIRFLENAKESSDKQLADTVRIAVIAAMMDPRVIDAADSGEIAAGDIKRITGLSDKPFGQAVCETLGVAAVTELDEIEAQLKSENAKEIHIEITSAKTVIVHITKAGETDMTKALITVPAE
ncbi:MAG: prepilin-type N-terminal cleavage/methylation domain-containing protein [Lachnospiraceae bacterium]|nr:prepilin-type N-terminal cleavage/methylation domain-containing protein [Lachnospiraceae bacterium]